MDCDVGEWVGAIVDLLSLKQDREESIRQFAARIAGKASILEGTEKSQVDFINKILKLAVLNGINDGEIKKDVLGIYGLDNKSFEELIDIIEKKDMAVRSLSGSQGSSVLDVPDEDENNMRDHVHDDERKQHVHDEVDEAVKANKGPITSKCSHSYLWLG